MKSLFPRTQFFALRALLLCACASAAFGQARPPAVQTPPLNWQEFASEAGAFTVKFPAKPTLKQVPFQKGPITFVRHVHEASVPGHYTFEIDYMDMPAGYNDPDLSTEGGITGMTRSMVADGGRVLTSGQVRQGTCEGRGVTVALPNRATGRDGFAHARVFTSGQRYYFLIFVGESDGEAARRVGQTFMDSFTVKGGCTKAVAPTAAPAAEPTRSTVEGTPDAATGWRRIGNAGQGFSVLMPGAAQLTSTQAQVQPFVLFHHEYLRETPETFYSAEVVGEYPAGFYDDADSYENLIDATLFVIKRNLAPLEFNYAAPRKLKVGAFPGREYDIESARVGARGRIQVYATPKHAYIFIYISRAKKSPDADLERFFSSVRISDK